MTAAASSPRIEIRARLVAMASAPRLSQPDTATAGLACGGVANQLDAGGGEGADEFRQRIDIAAHHPVARLHPLDGGDGEAGERSKLALIDGEESAGGAELTGSDHEVAIKAIYQTYDMGFILVIVIFQL